MKILLVNPPFQRLKKISTRYFPIGLGYLASVAVDMDVEAKIYNAELPQSNEKFAEESVDNLLQKHYLYSNALKDRKHYVWQEVKKVLAAYKPDIVGISVMTAKFSSALMVSRICRELLPDTTIIWGGPHPTISTEHVLGHKEIDMVIRREGENVFREYILAKKEDRDYSQIAGLSFKKNGKIQHNPPAELISDLDQLSPPSRSLSFFSERYNSSEMGSIITSRGCPFRCGFCGAKNIWTRKVRNRSIDNVIEEIAQIKEHYKVKYFYFWDDSFTVNRKRTIKLCQALIKNNLNIIWSCCTRVDTLDSKLLEEMKKAGCVNIDIGVESGSDKVLKEIRKDITTDQVRETIKMISKYSINVNVYFMVGFPTETTEDLKKTAQFMQDKLMGKILLSIFTPYPGSELYEQAEQLGLIPKDIDWSNFSHQSPENHFMKYVDKKEFSCIVKKFNNIVKAHNSNFSILWKVHRNRLVVYLKDPLKYIKKAMRIYS